MVARQVLTILAAVLISVSIASALSPPPDSDEVALDHGYRYEYHPDVPERSDIAVGDGVVLHAYLDGGRGFATLHDPSGPRPGWNLADLFTYGDQVRTFSCSDLDPLGWKVAYIGGVDFGEDKVLRVRNLDPETLESTASDLELASASRHMGYPMIARYPGGHVVLWADGTTLRHRRCTIDLEAIDDAPRQVATGVKWAALAWASSGGMVVWSDVEDDLFSQRLDADALPAGDPIACGSTGRRVQIDLAPLGAGWIVAWSSYDGIHMKLLDADGRLAKSRFEPMELDDGPVAVCSSDSSAIVLAGGIVCLRIDLDGHTIGDSIHLEDLWYVTYDRDWLTWDPRAYACAWTGASFSMLYHQFAQQITSRGERAGSNHARSRGTEGAVRYPGRYGVPVFAQWMDESGRLLHPESLLASQASVVRSTDPWTRGERTLVLMGDDATDLWLHSMQIDREGNVLAAPKRFRSPAYSAICDVWDCDWSRIGSPAVRPWGDDVACLYAYSQGHSSEWYMVDSKSLIVDRVSMEGDSLHRTAVPVSSGHDYGPSLASFDFAARPQDALAVYSTWRNAPSAGAAELLSPSGERLRRWALEADSVGTVAAAPLPGDYLLVWSQGAGSDATLRAAVLDPAMPDSIVPGAPLPAQGWRGWSPCLVPGLDRTLCVFAGRAPGETRDGLFAVFFDSAGAPLEPGPIDLHADRCLHCTPKGIWDSNHFFVVWSRWTEEDGVTCWATRLGRDGSLVDDTPFQLPISVSDLAVSADSLGTVFVGYENHVRIVDDTNPFVQEDPILPPWDDDWIRDVRIGRVLPNPSPGAVQLEVQLPARSEARVTIHDSGGRLLHETTVRGPRSGMVEVWDTRIAGARQAPAGAYYVQVVADGRTTRRRVFVIH